MTATYGGSVRIFSGIFFAALVGCQTTPQRAPAPPAVTRADIAVATTCVRPEDVAALPTTVMPPRTAGPDPLAVGADADLIVWRERGRTWREQLLACSTMLHR